MLKLCIIKNCGKKHFGKGYCQRHYLTKFYYPKNRISLRLYQKEYRLKKYGIGNKRRKCINKGCIYYTYKDNSYCSRHKYRIQKNLPLDLTMDCRGFHTPKGEKHYRWKDGVSQYPNHRFMQKQRLIILLNNPKCEICKKPAIQIHHKNQDKSDHRLSNLEPLCRKCHSRFHRENRLKPFSSKYRKKYGMSLEEITKEFGCSKSYWSCHPRILYNTIYKY